MSLVEHVTDRLNNFFPVSEEYVGIYQKLSGTWFALSGFCIEQTINQANHSVVANNPKEFAGMVALSAVTAGAGAFFYDRSWESRGEYDR